MTEEYLSDLSDLSAIAEIPEPAPSQTEKSCRLRQKGARIEDEAKHVTELGFKNGVKRFHKDESHTAVELAKEFIRANLFLQTATNTAGYVVYRCEYRKAGCDLDVKLWYCANDECELRISPGATWHSKECIRALQGPRGVSKLSNPKLSSKEAVVQSALDALTKENSIGRPPVSDFSLKQAYNQRSYIQRKAKIAFQKDPAKHLAN